MDRLSDYDYHLPPERIAAEPSARREDARLLVVERRDGRLTDRVVRDLPELLRRGDCLVLNDTKVIPARLFGRRVGTGGKWEGLYLSSTPDGTWKLIGQSGGKLRVGDVIEIVPAEETRTCGRLTLSLEARDEDGVWLARPSVSADALFLLGRYGTVPLPPYLCRKRATDTDWQRYQTVFARHPGAVAAPTAGLHFTPSLLSVCEARGISHTFITLHVGIGTFRPVAVEDLSEHRMHAEWYEISSEAVERIEQTRARGGRVVAVGTTTVRALESAARDARDGRLAVCQQETDVFIRPPYEFRIVDCLLTNFHLPKSTLLMLVSAFAGPDLTRAAYSRAIEAGYRFFSYGDAMLVL